MFQADVVAPTTTSLDCLTSAASCHPMFYTKPNRNAITVTVMGIAAKSEGLLVIRTDVAYYLVMGLANVFASRCLFYARWDQHRIFFVGQFDFIGFTLVDWPS